ncbi:MAG TPA: hypothetical protein ENI61_04120 [Ignavibacteria bacterium]|nr:hypothetical protein [Ignavibacteria bacterium]
MKIIQCYNKNFEYLKLSKLNTVEKIEMVGVNDYANTLLKFNKNDNLINIEHDITITQEDLDELENCKHDLCVFNYYIYPVSTGKKEKVLVHRTKITRDVLENGFIRHLVTSINFIKPNYIGSFVDYAGFGVIKIKKGILNKLNISDIEKKWQTFDSVCSEKFDKINMKFHLHKKILEHNHKRVL